MAAEFTGRHRDHCQGHAVSSTLQPSCRQLQLAGPVLQPLHSPTWHSGLHLSPWQMLSSMMLCPPSLATLSLMYTHTHTPCPVVAAWVLNFTLHEHQAVTEGIMQALKSPVCKPSLRAISSAGQNTFPSTLPTLPGAIAVQLTLPPLLPLLNLRLTDCRPAAASARGPQSDLPHRRTT